MEVMINGTSHHKSNRLLRRMQQNGREIQAQKQKEKFEYRCQLKWIEEMLEAVSVPPERTDGVIQNIIGKMLKWLEEVKVQTIVPFLTEMNVRLMLAAFHAWNRDFIQASEWLDSALDRMTGPNEEPEDHLRAFDYLIRANRYLMLTKNLPPESVPEAAIAHVNVTCQSASFRAVFLVAEGFMAKHFGLQEKQIELFKEATKLEPNYAEWHRLLYRCLRLRRRQAFPGSRPDRDERTAIETAFDLDADDTLTLRCYATMLDEEVKGRGRGELTMMERKEETAYKVIDLLRMCLDKNPEDRWTHVRLAEVYAYGTYPCLDHTEGEKLFQECERRWPDSSMVLHKFGKYYALRQQLDKALKYYTHGLEADASNYPCLMDYLKSVQRASKDYKLMLEMVERCMEAALHTSMPAMKLNLTKGILLWLLGEVDAEVDSRTDACNSFIEAAVHSPDSCNFIARKLASDYMNVTGNYYVDIPEVLEIIRTLPDVENPERSDVIKRLIVELEEVERNPARRPARLTRWDSATSVISSLSTCSFKTARTTLSATDLEDNWRVLSGSSPPSSKYVPPNKRTKLMRDVASYQSKNNWRSSEPSRPRNQEDNRWTDWNGNFNPFPECNGNGEKGLFATCIPTLFKEQSWPPLQPNYSGYGNGDMPSASAFNNFAAKAQSRYGTTNNIYYSREPTWRK